MKYLNVSRDGLNKVRRVRIGREGAYRSPSLVWNRDDAYDIPKLAVRWLPWAYLTFYPGLRGPVRFRLGSRRGEVESWRWYRRQIGLRLAGLSEDRLQAAADIVRDQQEQIRAWEHAHGTRNES